MTLHRTDPSDVDALARYKRLTVEMQETIGMTFQLIEQSRASSAVRIGLGPSPPYTHAENFKPAGRAGPRAPT
jgi:hypothetical protein